MGESKGLKGLYPRKGCGPPPRLPPPPANSPLPPSISICFSLQLAAVCMALRDHLAYSPQLWDAVVFDQYEDEQQRRHAAPTPTDSGNCATAASAASDAAAAALADWTPVLRRLDAPQGPQAAQTVHFESFLADRAPSLRRLRRAPASDWTHISVAPRIVELCTAVSSCTGLVSLEVSARCPTHLGIWAGAAAPPAPPVGVCRQRVAIAPRGRAAPPHLAAAAVRAAAAVGPRLALRVGPAAVASMASRGHQEVYWRTMGGSNGWEGPAETPPGAAQRLAASQTPAPPQPLASGGGRYALPAGAAPHQHAPPGGASAGAWAGPCAAGCGSCSFGHGGWAPLEGTCVEAPAGMLRSPDCAPF